MERHDNYYLLKIILKWKWYILSVSVIAAIATFCFSGENFITPRYQSEAIAYPANLKSRSTESNTEQMLQWLSSREIKDQIISKYNLVKHYKIDTSNPGYYTKLLDKYDQWINVSITKYQAIKIDVFDKNSANAFEIVHSILNLYDQKVNNEYKKKYKHEIEVKEKFLNRKKRELDTTLIVHRELSKKYGLLDYLIQAEEVTKGHLGTIDNLNHGNLNKNDINKLKTSLQEKGGEFIYYHKRVYDLLEQYNIIQKEYEDILLEYEKDLSYYYLVESPHKSHEPSYPNRFLYMIIAFAATFVLALIVIFAIEHKDLINNLTS
ncbi:MAG: hypothetical protein ACOC4B_00510 [Bacteroidota bacterium]